MLVGSLISYTAYKELIASDSFYGMIRIEESPTADLYLLTVQSSPSHY